MRQPPAGAAAKVRRRGVTCLVGGAAAVVTALVCTTSAVTPAAAAEAARFIPWSATPPATVVLKDLGGRPTPVAEYPGKVVLVSFWATWCEFCREQMLAMQQLKQRLAGQPLEIVAVNFGESQARAREYLRELSVDFRVLVDPNQDAARAWHVRVLPVSFVVGADGHPRYTVVGVVDWASDEVVSTIRHLMP